MRSLVLIAIAALAAAMCGDDSVSLDAAFDVADAVNDAPVDVPQDDGIDVLSDVAPDSLRDSGPASWTRLPGTPEFCDLEYASSPGSVLEEIRWAPCPSGPPDGCSVLEYDTGFTTRRENVAQIHTPSGAAQPVVVISQTQERDRTSVSAQLLNPGEPTILAAWRYTSDTELCRLRQLATDSDNLGYEVALPGNESLFFRTRLDALPSMPDEPIGRLTEAEQPGAVGTQDMQISATTLGVVLQPGAVLWFFEDGLQMRRGGPLEPGVPGAVLNQFSIVDRRLYWATAGSLVLAEALDAPSELLLDPPGDVGIRTPEADEEFVTWQTWDGDARAELWAAPIPATAAELAPFMVATFPEIATLGLGEGLVVRNTALDRIRLYDLRGGGTVREYVLPIGWRLDDDFLWVNRTDVGISVEREGATLFSTVMRVPIDSFEPL